MGEFQRVKSFQNRLSGQQFLPGACSHMFSSMGCSVDSLCCVCPTLIFHGLQGTICTTIVFSIDCREISALAPGTPPLLPSSLTLVSVVFSLAFSSSSASHSCHACFQSFLKNYHRGATRITHWLSFGQ